MCRRQREEVREEQLTGFKYFDRLGPLFARLHTVGCGPDKAHHRKLHFDQYCALVLLYLFNPVVVSLRSIQQASELQKVQRKLSCARASLGSLSESSHVFDPALLQEIIGELGAQLQPIAADGRLAELRHTVTLVDGTLLKALPRIAEAMWLSTRTGTKHHAWRLHTQFELDKHVPLRMELTDGRNSGPSDEKTVLRQHLQPDRCYVRDRWYAQFSLFNDIHRVHSSYVCRLRDNTVPEVIESRPLSAAALAAGVLSDEVVRLGQKPDARPDHPLRLHPPCQALTPQGPHRCRAQRWPVADRHQLAGRAGRDYRADLSVPLYDRAVLPLLQACLGVSPSIERRSPRHRNPNLLCDHRLHADQPHHRTQTELAHLRDDLLLLDGLGGRRGAAGASSEAEKTRRLNRSAALPAAITSRSMLRPRWLRRPLLTPPPSPAPRTLPSTGTNTRNPQTNRRNRRAEQDWVGSRFRQSAFNWQVALAETTPDPCC
jgi:Transposase DDE domain